MGEDLAKLYASRVKTDEEMVLILAASTSRIHKVVALCKVEEQRGTVRAIGVQCDLATEEGVSRLVEEVARACGPNRPLDRAILNHGRLSFVPRGSKVAEKVTETIREVNYESYRRIATLLRSRGLLDASITRMGVTSSSSVFTRSAYDHQLLGIHQYVRSKWSMTEWFLKEDLPVLSKTVCFPMGNRTRMTTGETVLANTDPVRKIVTDDRASQGAPIDPPTSWWVSSVITAPPEVTMQNHMKSIERGSPRSYTFQTLDEILYRWVCSSVPGVNSWYLTFSPLLFGSSGNVPSLIGLFLGQPLLLVQFLPWTGWPLLFLLHALPGGTSSHSGDAVWEAPLRPVRSLVFTYAFIELYLLSLRLLFVNFQITLTGALMALFGMLAASM